MGWIAQAPRRRRTYHVNPFVKEFTSTIFIEASELKKHDCKLHTIVRVELEKKRGRNYQAKIIEVLPSIDSPETELQIVAENRGLLTEFPKSVIKEIRSASLKDSSQRKDLTQTVNITIDGEDAKDFDDAIFVEALQNNSFRLIVSIADVSHFVRPGSQVDEEAKRRTTSVYFPGFAVPMLPEKLSNDLCSLVPNESRLTLSCEMKINSKGKVTESKIYPSKIKSHARLTYKEVQRFFDGKKLSKIGPSVSKVLTSAHDLYRLLRRTKSEKGALDFDLPETKIEVKKNGDVKDIKFSDRLEAHRLIEQFMILANESVSEAIEKKGYASVYRVHEEPDPEKLKALREILKSWKIAVPKRIPNAAKWLQSILDQVKDHPAERILCLSLLRSMKQAQYSAANVGHFGLASESYCHFTSPIRRYPDLLVHRILRESNFLKSKKSPIKLKTLKQLSETCSEGEQRAVLGERDMADLKKCRYLESKVGKKFKGVIITVKEFGFFVGIEPSNIEGLVHIKNLKGDYYRLDELGIELKGDRTNKQFKIGDRIEVQLKRVDRFERQIDFQYLRHIK